MYDLNLTTEQIEFSDTVRDFVAREIKPVALHPDRLQRRRPPFPNDLLALTAPLGLRTLALSEASGGAGADTLTACMVMEELATGDVDVATALAQTVLLAHVIFEEAMTAEQCARFLPRFVDDEAMHLAYAGGAGAAGAASLGPGWLYHRQRDNQPVVRPVAVNKGGVWAINGEAGFVANATIAGLIAVEADIANGGDNGTVLLLVPRHTPGLQVRETCAGGELVIPWFHGAGGTVAFTDCSVPADHLLKLPQNLARYWRRGIALQAAVNLGVGRVAFEAAVAYAKLRVQGGRPIIQHQAIGAKLADIAIGLEAARNLIWKAAWALDHPEAVAGRSITTLPLETAARVFTAETVRAATENAAECFGAMGVMLDMPLQKYVHDAVIFLHSATSGTVDKFAVAEAVAGFARSAA